METKDLVTAVIAGSAVFVATITFVKGLIEYRKQGVTKRVEIFLQLRARLRQDPVFSNICDLVEVDSPKLRDLPLIHRDRFIGFFEELALIRNSGLMNDQVCFYMFGYFAIRCHESSNFWHGLNKDQPLWSLFMDFAKQMESAQKMFKYERGNFHL